MLTEGMFWGKKWLLEGLRNEAGIGYLFSSVTHGQSRVALSDFSGLGRILTQV